MRPTEKDLQQLVTDFLRWHRFIVVETGMYTERQRPTCTVGAPDLYIAERGRNRWVAVELKLPCKADNLSPEQRELLESGVTEVCTSLEEVCDYLSAQGFTMPRAAPTKTPVVPDGVSLLSEVGAVEGTDRRPAGVPTRRQRDRG